MVFAQDQHDANNQPTAVPRPGQSGLSLTPPEQAELAVQPAKQQSVIAIVRPGNTSVIMTAEERVIYEESARLALLEPVPDRDDFADEPLPKPYDPETSTYDWAKADAWIEEKNSDGRTVWRNQIIKCVRNSEPRAVTVQKAKNALNKHDNNSPRLDPKDS